MIGEVIAFLAMLSLAGRDEQHKADADEQLGKTRELLARARRGEEKLRAALALCKADEARKPAHERKKPTTAEVCAKGAGLVRDSSGRWVCVPKKPRATVEPPKHPKHRRRRKPSTKPAPSTGRAPVQAARDLDAYLRTPGANWGWQGTPSAFVELAQHDMQGDTGRPGIVGRRTRARALQLGVRLPAAPTAAPARRLPAPAPAPRARAAAHEPLPKTDDAQVDDDAAERRRRRAARKHRAAMLAARRRRAAARRAARRRAAEDATPAPSKPAARTPEQAARDLDAYLRTPGANWGWQGTPSAVVELAQHDMQGDTGRPGIMGPLTRARARALGVTLPAGPR